MIQVSKALKKDGSLKRKFLLSFKNATMRVLLNDLNMTEFASNFKKKAGGFHKVRAWEASKNGNAFVEVGKKGCIAVIRYPKGGLRQAMAEANYLNEIIEAVLAPKIPQDASHCPKCGNENVSWDRLETDGDSASQGGFCNKCNCRWASVFKFAHNEILN